MRPVAHQVAEETMRSYKLNPKRPGLQKAQNIKVLKEGLMHVVKSDLSSAG